MEHKVALSAFLAVHHHQNNMAMLFTHPSTKVRLLLSYVLYETREQTARIILGIRYRAIISECHLQFAQIQDAHTKGLLSEDEAMRRATLWVDKAEVAHNRLLELSNA